MRSFALLGILIMNIQSFSMIFGAGIVLMVGRAEASGRGATALHLRRMLLLIAFGAIHAYLLWYGDILVIYGMSGLVVYLFRRRSSRTLFASRGRPAGDRIEPFPVGGSDAARLAGSGPTAVHRDLAASTREHPSRVGDLSRRLAGTDGPSRGQVLCAEDVGHVFSPGPETEQSPDHKIRRHARISVDA